LPLEDHVVTFAWLHITQPEPAHVPRQGNGSLSEGSMKRNLTAVATLVGTAIATSVATTASAAVFFEPFDYPAGNLGLNINPSVNQTWYSSASSGADDRVQVDTSGGLSAPTGLPGSTGGMATFGGAGRSDRIFLGTNRTSGSVFYSLLLNVSDLTGTGSTGGTFFGFNNTAQTSLNHDTAAQPSAISGRLIIKAIDASTYQVGASKASGTAADFVFTPIGAPFNINTDTVFIVGRYTFNTGTTTDDTFDLWVNPSAATFADDALMPAPTMTATGGGDGGQIATIVLRQFTAVVPAGIKVDEIRVDTKWAHVTSNLVPEPSSLVLLAAVAPILRTRRRRRNPSHGG
jgi:hypothetical protein